MNPLLVRVLPLLALLFSSTLWAQAAALGTGGVNTAQNNNSLAFTVPAGTNRVLIVAVETIGNPSAVSFNGQALSEIGAQDAGSSIRGELWGIALGTGGAIASTISASGFNTTNSWNVVAAQAFENIDQATPWEGFVSDTTGGGNGSTSINVTSEADDLVFDAVVAQGNGSAMTATVGPGQTTAFNGTTGNGLGAGSYEAGAATTTMSWDFTNFFAGSHMGLNLNGVPAVAEADIGLTSTESTDPVIAGSGAGNLVYVVTATNNGPADATGVAASVTVTWPAGVSVDSVTPSGSGTWSDTFPGTWTIGNLANSASETLTITLTADSSAATGADAISLSANVSAVNESDTNGVNDTTGQTTSIARNVDISLAKSESNDPVVAGSGDDNLTYVVTATNNGPSDVTDLVISDAITVPANVTVQSVTPSSGSWTDPDWTVSIAAGGSETLTVVIDVPLTADEGTDVISDQASVESSGGGETFINNGDDSVTESTSIVWPEATFDVEKVYQGDDGGPVTATLNCTDASGLIEYAPQQGTTPTSLTVRRFDDGATSCTVTESDIPAGFFVAERSAECDVDPVTDGGSYACTITNAETRVTFAVTKDFTDNNPGEIEVFISCDTGLPLDQSKVITEAEGVTFVVTDFDEGELDCEITEDGETGYIASYFDGTVTSDMSCAYEAIGGGSELICEITNTPAPVDVVIEKDWILEGTGASSVDQSYSLTLFCDAEIVGGINIGLPFQEAPQGVIFPGCGPIIALDEQEAGQLIPANDWCIAFNGNGPDTFIAEVIPEYPDSSCYVVETVFDSAVEVDNDCQNITVSAGVGDACTITNTVFFEGIPTLNQYGMALLALLMLGVGFVGFRRFA